MFHDGIEVLAPISYLPDNYSDTPIINRHFQTPILNHSAIIGHTRFMGYGHIFAGNNPTDAGKKEKLISLFKATPLCLFAEQVFETN